VEIDLVGVQGPDGVDPAELEAVQGLVNQGMQLSGIQEHCLFNAKLAGVHLP